MWLPDSEIVTRSAPASIIVCDDTLHNPQPLPDFVILDTLHNGLTITIKLDAS